MNHSSINYTPKNIAKNWLFLKLIAGITILSMGIYFIINKNFRLTTFYFLISSIGLALIVATIYQLAQIIQKWIINVENEELTVIKKYLFHTKHYKISCKEILKIFFTHGNRNQYFSKELAELDIMQTFEFQDSMYVQNETDGCSGIIILNQYNVPTKICDYISIIESRVIIKYILVNVKKISFS